MADDSHDIVMGFPQADQVYTVKRLLECMNGRLSLNKAIDKLLQEKGFDQEAGELTAFSFFKATKAGQVKILMLGNHFPQGWHRQYFARGLLQPFRVLRSEVSEQALMQITMLEDEYEGSTYSVLLPYFELTLQIESFETPFKRKEDFLVAVEFTPHSDWMMLGVQVLENWASHHGFDPSRTPVKVKGLKKIPEGSFARWQGQNLEIHNIWVHNVSRIPEDLKRLYLGLSEDEKQQCYEAQLGRKKAVNS